MICKKCGYTANDNDNYCYDCGNKLILLKEDIKVYNIKNNLDNIEKLIKSRMKKKDLIPYKGMTFDDIREYGFDIDIFEDQLLDV